MTRSRRSYSGQDRFGGSGLGPSSKIHAPRSHNFDSLSEWLFMLVLYFGSGPIFACIAVIAINGWSRYLTAFALITVWFWVIALRVPRQLSNVYRTYRHEDDVEILWVYEIFRDQDEWFAEAGLSISQGDSRKKSQTPQIVRHRIDNLGMRLLVEILRCQEPEMFIAATDRLSSALITPVEVRKFDHSHVEIILKLRDPLTSVREANIHRSDSTDDDGRFEVGRA